jgi:small neutral amino acid transporter SnatA (MarC family)
MQSYPEISWWVMLIISIFAIILTMVLTYVIFLSSGIVIKVLGKKGMDAFTRVMGLLTVAIAVQFALTGLSDWIININM